MPPRAAPTRGSRGGARGGRGAGPPRGGGSGPLAFGLPSAGSHITTVGVKRPNFGTGGRELPIFANSFVTTIPEGVIHHYDGKLEIMVEICALIFFFLQSVRISWMS
jgi:eukaryotic translation initiation factor 2C